MAGGVEIAEWIRKECNDFIGGYAAFARDPNRLGCPFVRTCDLAGRAKVAIRIDDDQRGWPAPNRLGGSAGSVQKPIRHPLIVNQRQLLIGADHGLHRVPRIHPQFFSPSEEQACTDERRDNASTTQREQKLAPLAVHQHDPSQGHQEVHHGENNVAPVSRDIGKAALQKDVRVIGNDRVDTRSLVAGEDDAGQQERDHIFSPQQRVLDLCPGRCLGLLRQGSLFHLPEFGVCLIARP